MEINFGIKGIDNEMFTIRNINKIIAYPSESELSNEELTLNGHTSFKFFYSSHPYEQGREYDKALILNASDIIYMKVIL